MCVVIFVARLLKEMYVFLESGAGLHPRDGPREGARGRCQEAPGPLGRGALL